MSDETNIGEATVPVASSGEGATVQTLAAEAASWFESAYRDNCDANDEPYIRLKDGAPEWVRDLVYTAHGDFGPDDWRYNCIDNACEWISQQDEDDPGDFADQQVDVYTGRRLAWLASNLNRVGYCDEAASEFGYDEGHSSTSIVDRIGWGQYMEASEVYGLVYQALTEQLDEVTA